MAEYLSLPLIMHEESLERIKNRIRDFGGVLTFAKGDVTPAGQFITIVVTTLMRDGIDVNILGFKNSKSTAWADRCNRPQSRSSRE